MTTELAIVPHTGEVLELERETPVRLAELLGEIRDLESRLRETKALITDEFHRRMDKTRQYTLHLPGGIKVSGKSDALVSVWDGQQLQEVLEAMAAEGEIEPDVIARTVTEEITWRVHAREANALLKSPALAPRIEACRVLVEPSDRRVSVSRG